MKFKVAVISLLSAILAISLFTAYTLIDKANKQFELQCLNTEIEIESYQLDRKIMYYVDEVEDATIRSERWTEEYQKICGTN